MHYGLLPAILLIAIALIFLKNQTRPIINLAKASAKFGRGEDIDEFRPSGALEIRQAGYEFDRMKKNNAPFKSKIRNAIWYKSRPKNTIDEN